MKMMVKRGREIRMQRLNPCGKLAGNRRRKIQPFFNKYLS